MSNKRQWPYVWQHVEGLGEVLTRGTHDGLPVLAWGWAPRDLLATARQLRAMGLRPGGADPVAALMFQHHTKGRKATDFALLYLVPAAAPKRTATPAQQRAVATALRARRTCRDCGQVDEFYLSTISRLCAACEDRTDFWRSYAEEHGYTWEVAA